MTTHISVSQFLAGGKPSGEPPDENDLKAKATVARAQLLRNNQSLLPSWAFRMRREAFIGKENGILNTKPEVKSMQEAMMTNPDMMSGMLKQQLGTIVPQLAMGAVVSFFFSGFILGKMPFALSPRFKVMLQRGIDLPSLDPSYFTSLSFYILLLFGLRGVLILIFSDKAINDMAAMQQMQGGMTPLGFDAAKAFEAERKALELTQHNWGGRDCEKRVTAILKAQIHGKV